MQAIGNLSRAEKLQMMEALWDDLTRSDQPYASPAWHAEALKESEQAYQAGETDFVDWETAKKILREGGQ